jgi:hypothetical protein
MNDFPQVIKDILPEASPGDAGALLCCMDARE